MEIVHSELLGRGRASSHQTETRAACDLATAFCLREAQVTQPRDFQVEVGTDGPAAFYLCSFS